MKLLNIQKNKGFTIIEALVAVFILTISLAALLNVTASSTISSRYARNSIVANYLLQEAIDSVRNSRDTIVFKKKGLSDGGWANFISRYENKGCFDTLTDCSLKMEIFNPADIGGSDVSMFNDNYLKYDASGSHGAFYLSPDYVTTSGDGIVVSNFKRYIKMEKISGVEGIRVTAFVEFKNGLAVKTQSLSTVLLNWQQDY